MRPPVAARLVHQSSKYVISRDPLLFYTTAHTHTHMHDKLKTVNCPASLQWETGERGESGGGRVKELATFTHPDTRSFCTAHFPSPLSVINLAWLCVALPSLALPPSAQHKMSSFFCSQDNTPPKYHEPLDANNDTFVSSSPSLLPPHSMFCVERKLIPRSLVWSKTMGRSSLCTRRRR